MSVAASVRSSAGWWPGHSPWPSRSSCRSCSAASGSTGRSSCRATSASTSSTRGSVWRSLCAVIVWYLIYRGITLSTRAGVVLGVIEVAIFLLISALLIVNAPQNTIERLHPGRRWRPAGLPGDDLLPARVRRLRGGGAARRGGAGTAAHDPAGDHLVGRPRRPVLRLQLLRRDGVLRSGADDRVLHVQRRRSVGLHGRRGAADRRAARRVRDPEQLPRERELGRDGRDPLAVRDGSRHAAPALVRRRAADLQVAGQRRPLPGGDWR